MTRALNQPRGAILFVGTDPGLAEAFRAEFDNPPGVWPIALAGTAAEALARLEEEPFEAVVVESQLPDGPGMQLLDAIMRRHSHPVRILRGGALDSENTLKGLGKAHYYLLEPCEPATLLSLLEEAGTTRARSSSEALCRVVGQMRHLPSPPAIYFQVLQAVQAEEASLDQVGQLILQDPALSGKLLQLANSAVFGLQLKVIHPVEAIGYVGLETTKALLLLAHTFSFFEDLERTPFSMESLGRHSLAVGRAAQRMAQAEGAAPDLRDQAFTAGLLHDLGKLFFAANLPREFNAAMELARAEGGGLWQAERQIFGTDHAEVAGYVLGTWHLPSPIVQAVAWHHCPGQNPNQVPEFTPLTAVHVANALERQAGDEPDGQVPSAIDAAYLEQLGLGDRLGEWITPGVEG